MLHLSGESQESLLIIHGGAGPQDPTIQGLSVATEALTNIARAALAEHPGRMTPVELATTALMGMEDHESFNAGFGSALQSDGAIRVTAAMMDGSRQAFSAVIGLGFTRHPSLIAKALQTRRSRVLAAPGHELMARELGLPVESLVTPKRLATFYTRSESTSGLCDTVGALVRDEHGQLAAGTSTGGRGFEFPGRVSDSGTVAGNYASALCAVSATGIGEEIIDDGLAVRLETRVRDGLPLAAASERCYQEALDRGRQYGWISLSRDGAWAVAHTTPAMTFVVITLSGIVLASSLPKV